MIRAITMNLKASLIQQSNEFIVLVKKIESIKSWHDPSKNNELSNFPIKNIKTIIPEHWNVPV